MEIVIELNGTKYKKPTIKMKRPVCDCGNEMKIVGFGPNWYCDDCHAEKKPTNYQANKLFDAVRNARNNDRELLNWFQGK